MYNKQYWEERYAQKEYLYGTEANAFLVANAKLLQGSVLSLSEGEGRNGVFLAKRGLDVHGVDISATALEKAQALATLNKVKIKTTVADLTNYLPEKNSYNTVISIGAHLPSAIRAALYPQIEKCLKSGGIVLLEAYSEQQLSKQTGGPKDIDMLMSIDKLKKEFPKLEPILIQEIERDLQEGEGHTGLSSVVQFIARKKD